MAVLTEREEEDINLVAEVALNSMAEMVVYGEEEAEEVMGEMVVHMVVVAAFL